MLAPRIAFPPLPGAALSFISEAMCGRYTLIASAEAIRLLFDLPAFDERLVTPRYNIAPTQPIAVVRETPKGREILPMRWGLFPAWAKDPNRLPLLINARAESIMERPAYRWGFKYRRCLVPASGFYEWKAGGRGPKQPYLASPGPSQAGGAPLIAFAGVWETWLGADGSEIDTAAIVTTTACEFLAPIHDRTPAVIAPKDFEAWLSHDTQLAEARALLRPAPEDLFSLTPVSTRVNSAENDDRSLIERAELPPAQSEPTPHDDQLTLF
jgi:putative SOS response-associated peptidase YedK